ncbi:hypothetical protein [Streptomyces toxytricini]|uniref:hypothetical protein n=1 Tax=Streptomyces toxytricini TaxID=67369 RepID=UPI0034221601
MTTDPAKARDWLESWTDVSGVEGILCKPQTSRYLQGHRGAWTKVGRRDTTEAVVGAITGTLTRPQLLVLGRHDQAAGSARWAGRWRCVRSRRGRSPSMWPPRAGASVDRGPLRLGGGSRDVLDVTLVRPELVAEVSADRSVDRGGVFRHPLRFKRLRLDVSAGDVPGLGAGSAAAAAAAAG